MTSTASPNTVVKTADHAVATGGVASHPIRCPHCGSNPLTDGFVVETTDYQAYVPDGKGGLERHQSNGIARLARCLPCSKTLPFPLHQLDPEVVF